MNTTLVIDTSVIVKYLNKVNEKNIDKADDIIPDLSNPQISKTKML
jgi:hypothetical protein